MYSMTIAITALKSNSSNSPKTYIWYLKLLPVDSKQMKQRDWYGQTGDLLDWSLAITRCCKSQQQEPCLESQTANVTTLKDKITRFFEAFGSRYCPKKSLLKTSSKAKRVCASEIKSLNKYCDSRISPSRNPKKSCRGFGRSSGPEKQIPARCRRSHLPSLFLWSVPKPNCRVPRSRRWWERFVRFSLIHRYRFLFEAG